MQLHAVPLLGKKAYACFRKVSVFNVIIIIKNKQRRAPKNMHAPEFDHILKNSDERRSARAGRFDQFHTQRQLHHAQAMSAALKKRKK